MQPGNDTLPMKERPVAFVSNPMDFGRARSWPVRSREVFGLVSPCDTGPGRDEGGLLETLSGCSGQSKSVSVSER